MTLSQEELKRFARHTILPEIGIEGQVKLKKASVLIIGTGGLGSPIALYLAASGIGHMGLVDFDVVDESNLQRQILHGTSNIGSSKLTSAAESIQEINPFVKLDLYNEILTSENALSIIKKYDVVTDGTDNFQTRYLINDACVLTGKPNVFGSIRQFEGQASVYWAEQGPCYRCLFPEPPSPGSVPSGAEAGVIGVLPGVIGTLQATEVIKVILGIGEPLIGRLLNYDALKLSFNEVKFMKDPDCPICGEHPSITKLIDYDTFCGINNETKMEN
ncbi:MAG: molybdopterin-synthase adenylyltransferase MoeB [Marinilabiliaceae bacterium]|nr:molybdopterin-synthase adenylyltransferase MoeB [Marinilabiliaceae bacterium]